MKRTIDRRHVAAGALATALGAGLARAQPAPAIARPADLAHARVVDVDRYARADAGRAQTEAIQAAIDAARIAGVPLVFGRGHWLTDAPLRIWHTERRRRAFPLIVGAGVGETIIEAQGFPGALIEVRGVPFEPPAGTFFFWGGGIFRMTLLGAANGPAEQHALEVQGWWHGQLESVHVSRFGGSGLVVTGDPDLHANPDWTASTLTVRECAFERLGGWGFLDANPIGAFGFTFEKVLFNLCGEGGAWVRSHGNRFEGCSFAGCGFLDERTASAGAGIGLRVGNRAGWSVNRLYVGTCEFDTNRDAHLALDHMHSFRIDRTRFIHHDRYRFGSVVPPRGIVIARSGHDSAVRGGVFSELNVRIDRPGVVTGIEVHSTANVASLVVDGLLAQSEHPASLARFRAVAGRDGAQVPRSTLEVRR